MSLTSEIYEWFMTGKKPTQAQFWAAWGSFWNKAEQIPQSAVSNLTTVLNAKAEKAQFDAHKTDPDAHPNLLDEPMSRIEALEAKTDSENNFKVITGYTLDPITRVLTMNAGWVGTINGDDYTNVADQELVPAIPLAAEGYSRIDLIVFDTDANFERIAGVESLFTPVAPPKPDDTLEATFLTVGDGYVNAPVIPKPKAPVTSVNGQRGDVIVSSDVITTTKEILSTALATQNVAGIVSYINALNPVLIVAANEIVKYQLSDTGRVFELLLRGRIFGVGQTAIVAANVLEFTDFLNKDIKLSNYPNTRNDGANPTNKVLGTDANGNLKSYSMTGFPAPYLDTVIPDSNLPLTNFNILLKGDFFTPNMTIAFAGQTVVSKTFINSKEYRISLTTGSTEGLFSITLNNGVSITYPNAFLVVLGTPYTPVIADFINVSAGITVNDGELIANVTNTLLAADLNIAWDMTKKFRVYFSIVQSPLIAYASQYYAITTISNTVNSNKLRFFLMDYTPNGYVGYSYNNTDPTSAAYDWQNSGNYNRNYYIDWDLTNMRLFANDVFQWDFPANNLSTGMVLKFSLRNHDIKRIKYIELP